MIQKIGAKPSKSLNAIGRPKWRQRRHIVTWPNASTMRSAKVFLCAWPKRKSVMHNAGRKNSGTSAQKRPFSRIQSGVGLAAGGIKLLEPKSPFDGWKRPKNGRRPSFMNKPSAPSPEKKMCGNSCGKVQSRKKRMHEHLVPWRRRLARGRLWTQFLSANAGMGEVAAGSLMRFTARTMDWALYLELFQA